MAGHHFIKTTCLMFFLWANPTHPKTFDFKNFSLEIPEDIYIKETNEEDFTIYNLYNTKKENILNLYIGNFPNRNIIERSSALSETPLTQYKNIKIPYWNCIENKEEICSVLEITFDDIDFPNKVQFFYETSNKNKEIVNNIIKSFSSERKIFINNGFKFQAKNQSSEVFINPCFSINLLNNMEIIGRSPNTDIKNNFIIKNIETNPNINPIGFITFKVDTKDNTDAGITTNQSKHIDFSPFFIKLKNKFKRISITSQNPSIDPIYYKNTFLIPFNYKNNEYYSLIKADIRYSTDAFALLTLLNSINFIESEKCKL
ncbi:hypothetical protein GCM10025882_24300 [Acinetobacter gyllenbergii]|uniref:Uncharacterized protein n=1 Tax=Acinetobacter gyllenbergii CIP 110306 = MTCC 11365 TaxID=1217657 RepID=A0A829HCN6_9GAMM|nr:hypothetical protein [Acinetobacter gyllenbergii]EPF73028.1 hypothetical protein F957_03637 [Acinetobacter gyllenbergii CIP 110306 = MTCC 11365]EPH35439.1 hypothetical protein L293_0030 [Acinetobacter gyllenbergii CIP 110306 = MTCC 11365]GMA12005.1 hypothetical protein GCM10025882_24300 [Acinetobacter gyllenbergii]